MSRQGCAWHALEEQAKLLGGILSDQPCGKNDSRAPYFLFKAPSDAYVSDAHASDAYV